MTDDFDYVNAALASSTAGRALTFIDDVMSAAWRTSAVGATARSMSSTMKAMPAASLIRTIAVAIVIAAAVQPILIAAMPLTVAPAVPRALFVIVAIFASLVAWQAEAIHSAWSTSRLARLMRH